MNKFIDMDVHRIQFEATENRFIIFILSVLNCYWLLNYDAVFQGFIQKTNTMVADTCVSKWKDILIVWFRKTFNTENIFCIYKNDIWKKNINIRNYDLYASAKIYSKVLLSIF